MMEEEKPKRGLKKKIAKRKTKKRIKKGWDVNREVHANDGAANARVSYPTNYVSTTKYSAWNFLPKNLWEQFHRVANIYFVLIAIITLTPVSPIAPGPGVLTIVLVLAISAFKDAYEDFQRYKSDREINRRTSLVLRSGEFVAVQWQDIVVGDIVRVSQNEQFPADLILLSSEKDNGQAHVMTANLDGETNLKIRQALPATKSMRGAAELAALRAAVQCEEPNPEIYTCNASMRVGGVEQAIGVGVEQMLVRGTVLKNTHYANGLVIYTGPQTKYMLNVTDPPFKVSSIERLLNKIIIGVLVALLLLCLICAIFSGIWEEYVGEDMWYLDPEDLNFAGIAFKRFFTFLVLYNNLIPISLYVTMEMVRVMQARFIEADRAMYHFDSKFRAICRTSALNEELGQVEYIFSDKTGTLTANQMRFRMCSIGGQVFGQPPELLAVRSPDALDPLTPVDDSDVAVLMENAEQEGIMIHLEGGGHRNSDDDGDDNRRRTHRNAQTPPGELPFRDDALDALLNRGGGGGGAASSSSTVERGEAELSRAGAVIEFFVALAICNTVFPDHLEDGSIDYQAESPDELALVLGARDVGVELHTREDGKVTVNVLGDDVQFEVLNVLPFDSTRKRMSVVVRMPNDVIKVMTKGADNCMMSILASTGNLVAGDMAEHVDQFARLGLRTLVFGERAIAEDEYREWLDEYWQPYAEALGDAKSDALAAAIGALESEQMLVGATAIEDKLQIGVPETIETLMKADIKLWVLTGDKQETAINIGRTCSLVGPDTELIVLNLESLLESSGKASGGGGDSDDDDDGERVGDGGPTVEDLLEEQPPLRAEALVLDAIEAALASYDAKRDYAVVINGATINVALRDAVKLRFLELSQRCASVVVCRATPLNKRDVVRLVRRYLNPVTLAIGDGANDVSMIQEAQIGVGIKGEEGMQAVLNSDYAIGQFRFLARLLLVHGRWNYKRNALIVCYFFYKNFLLSLVPLFFAFDNGFSGQAYFDAWLRRAYNVIFTSLPIIVVCVLEQDIAAPGLLKYPQLYIECQRNLSFNAVRFAKWSLWGLIDALLCYYIVRFSTFGDSGAFDATAQSGGVYLGSTTVYTAVVVLVNLRLALHTRYWTIIHHIFLWGTIALWYIFAPIYSSEFSFFLDSGHMYYVAYRLYESPAFWLLTFFIPFVALAPDFMFRAVRRTWYPRSFHVIQEATQLKLEADLRHQERQRWCLERSDWPCRCCRRCCVCC
jgi:phospholipid-translocating P-type ATPase (flippase)